MQYTDGSTFHPDETQFRQIDDKGKSHRASREGLHRQHVFISTYYIISIVVSPPQTANKKKEAGKTTERVLTSPRHYELSSIEQALDGAIAVSEADGDASP